ncbi:MAG: hypothetical protein DRP01_06940 [Archaeoglobales archaeon]|nr:MAG: hypothetical protein DRP01_06940 [Archaeoglobales archaeon]
MILGCAEKGNITKFNQTPVVTPTEEEKEQVNRNGSVIIPTQPEKSAVKPTQKLTENTSTFNDEENKIQGKQEYSRTSENLLALVEDY